MGKKKITDYQPDPNNANKGTERGQYMVENSLEQFGAARSIVVDKNGIVLAGNKTQEAAINAGLEDAIEVESDGQKLVVVKRTDLDLLEDPKRAQEYAIADNRASEVGLEWDSEVLAGLKLDDEINLEQFFYEDEMNDITGNLDEGLLNSTVDYDSSIEGQQSGYLNSDIRRIILLYAPDEFDDLLNRVKIIMNDLEIKNHSVLFLRLVEDYFEEN